MSLITNSGAAASIFLLLTGTASIQAAPQGFVRATAVTSGLTGSRRLPAAAALGALGVVYGDIGTSPLYALREATKAAC